MVISGGFDFRVFCLPAFTTPTPRFSDFGSVVGAFGFRHDRQTAPWVPDNHDNYVPLPGIDLHLDGRRRNAALFLPFQFAPYSTINPALEVKVTNN